MAGNPHDFVSYPLERLGMDSDAAVEWAEQMNQATGRVSAVVTERELALERVLAERLEL